MKKIVKLTESDLKKLIGNIVSEQSVQPNKQDEIKRLTMEIEKLKKQIAANELELKRRAELEIKLRQIAKGPKK